MDNIAVLAAVGLLSGVLAGFLGIGGGTILVPIMVQLGFTPVAAVATSSLAILVTSLTGSLQNWRMGYLSPKKVLLIGFPALITAQIGVVLANVFPDYWLLFAFGMLLVLNVYLVGLRKRVVMQAQAQGDGSLAATAPETTTMNPTLARLVTGGSAGFLAGLFGVGGGVIMVPLQILLLGEKIKTAVQTSLGVIVITAISACVGHAVSGNVRFDAGLLIGVGGLLGVQVSTRFLPKLPDRVVSLLFRGMLGLLSIYIFWQAWSTYSSQ
ncbi:permease [filamentous cyanobacterium CCP5]|nr:permease [filamentous cyanobacterium CCP5]